MEPHGLTATKTSREAGRKQELLRQFKSLSAIGQAPLPELERLLPKDAAAAVYHHFHDGNAQE